jgi:hypothetical protein
VQRGGHVAHFAIEPKAYAIELVLPEHDVSGAVATLGRAYRGPKLRLHAQARALSGCSEGEDAGLASL